MIKPSTGKTTKTIKLGTFEVLTSTLRISDPCYDKKTWCAGVVGNVLTGTWKARVKKVDLHDNWGNRCRKLFAWHESVKSLAGLQFVRLPIDVGVDSGQAGIFDDSMFKVDYTENYSCVGGCEYDQRGMFYSAKSEIPRLEDNIKEFEELDKKLIEAGEKVDAADKLTDLYRGMLEVKKEIVKNGLKFNYTDAQQTKDWYEVCCDKTLSEVGAGTIRNGVVSSSGDGDGSYNAYAAYDTNGKVIAVKILF